MAPPDPAQRFRFLDFDLDVAGYQLRRNGRPVRLERQPMDLLILLVANRQRLVTRAEIVDSLWGKDVFVDVETGVHTAVRKIRLALHDSPDAPTFVETVPGKGYRFVAPIQVVPAPSGSSVAPEPPTRRRQSPRTHRRRPRRRCRRQIPAPGRGRIADASLLASSSSRWRQGSRRGCGGAAQQGRNLLSRSPCCPSRISAGIPIGNTWQMDSLKKPSSRLDRSIRNASTSSVVRR